MAWHGMARHALPVSTGGSNAKSLSSAACWWAVAVRLTEFEDEFEDEHQQ
jgi:hypothetical protein